MNFAIGEQSAPHDAVFVAPDFNAAAVWLPPSESHLAGRAGLAGCCACSRACSRSPVALTRVMALGEAMEEHHPPQSPGSLLRRRRAGIARAGTWLFHSRSDPEARR